MAANFGNVGDRTDVIEGEVHRDMECYDALPAKVRRALSYARFKYSAEQFWLYYVTGMPEDALAKAVELSDRSILDEKEKK